MGDCGHPHNSSRGPEKRTTDGLRANLPGHAIFVSPPQQRLLRARSQEARASGRIALCDRTRDLRRSPACAPNADRTAPHAPCRLRGPATRPCTQELRISSSIPNWPLHLSRLVTSTPQAWLLTAGGAIYCRRCQARSKRSGLQCLRPASRGKHVCRHHGALSAGPVTIAGKYRSALARTTHAQSTKAARLTSRKETAALTVLEMAAYFLGILRGPRTRGRKVTATEPALPELQAAVLKIIARAKHTA